MESWRSSPSPTIDSAKACSQSGDSVISGMNPASLVLDSEIWRASSLSDLTENGSRIEITFHFDAVS
jgi:hypothetical protein